MFTVPYIAVGYYHVTVFLNYYISKYSNDHPPAPHPARARGVCTPCFRASPVNPSLKKLIKSFQQQHVTPGPFPNHTEFMSEQCPPPSPNKNNVTHMITKVDCFPTLYLYKGEGREILRVSSYILHAIVGVY